MGAVVGAPTNWVPCRTALVVVADVAAARGRGEGLDCAGVPSCELTLWVVWVTFSCLPPDPKYGIGWHCVGLATPPPEWPTTARNTPVMLHPSVHDMAAP